MFTDLVILSVSADARSSVKARASVSSRVKVHSRVRLLQKSLVDFIVSKASDYSITNQLGNDCFEVAAFKSQSSQSSCKLRAIFTMLLHSTVELCAS